MKGQAPISSIYRRGPNSNNDDPERMFSRIWRWCRDLWVLNGTIVARPDELPAELKEPMVEWANETYGERKRGTKKRT